LALGAWEDAVRRRGEAAIEPCNDSNWGRLIEAERNKSLGVPTGATRAVVFGAPSRLVEHARELANAHEPPAERLICHPDDFRAAGLARLGPEVFIAITPRRLPAFVTWKFGDPMPDELRPRKAVLRPQAGCPRAEVWIDPTDPCLNQNGSSS